MYQLKNRGIAATALTAANIEEDHTLWRQVEDGVFKMVYASPEILLGDNSYFWKVIMRGDNAFKNNLCLVAVDECHVVWDWRDFRSEYKFIGRLLLTLQYIPFALYLRLNANVMRYVQKATHLLTPTMRYKQTSKRQH